MATATQTEKKNPLLELHEHGQSPWYDYIRRGLIESGELQRLIDEDGLRGVTSNPSIWEKAIAGSTDYAGAIQELRSGGESDPKTIYEALAFPDLRDAADAFKPVYDAAERNDGLVSIEVPPDLAKDTDATIAEAERLWKAIDRENLMIKIPATPEGLPAIRATIAKGINVNITLLFAVPVYAQVFDAYMGGLEELAAAGGELSRVASVASFFVSRIDTQVDQRLDDLVSSDSSAERRELARGLEGKIAIANAKAAYEHYQETIASGRWKSLADAGANVQRLLWASTSVKNPRYRDTLYVEELIGADTVNTVPPATFDAFRDHGRVRDSLAEDVDEAHDQLKALDELGISLTDVTTKLTQDGVEQFEEAFAKLFKAIGETKAAEPGPAKGQRSSLPGEIDSEVTKTIREWGKGKVRRLWARDASLWTGDDEADWLGWLDIADEQLRHGGRLDGLAEDVKKAGFTHALLLGMGGSSLCPEMLSLTFPTGDGCPELHILDSTDPAQVKAREEGVDLAKTLFFVSSKSGSTLEPNIFKDYFFDRVKDALGGDEAPKRFIAITDEGSDLEKLAGDEGFRDVFHGVKSIGGRYSALSNFGMAPGAAMGIDIHELLDRAQRMAHACTVSAPPGDNPGLALGATIGVCVNNGRDKLTLVTSPGIHDLGAWLEQLLAESTGKQGHGVVPVDREPIGDPGSYGDDRLFVYARLASDPDPKQDAAVDALEKAGHPVVRLELDDIYDLGGEIFRWEFATAVAGSVIGINPFNQPDVEAAKVEARKLTDEYEKKGSLPSEAPIVSGDAFAIYADERNAKEISDAASSDSFDDLLKAHLARIGAGDYAALLAYVENTPEHEGVLTEIRTAIRDATKAATCVGFGPRFQHSTGQAYKGGPNSGVFIQITCDDPEDLDVPGHKFTFGIVKAAQARGDLQVLADRGRRAIRVHLSDVDTGLIALRDAVKRALE